MVPGFEQFAMKAVGDMAKPLGEGLGSALSGADSGFFTAGAARGGAYGTTLDGAGWIVNMGGLQTASASPVRTTSNGGADGLPLSGALAPISAGLGSLPGLLLAAALVVMVIKRKRGG